MQCTTQNIPGSSCIGAYFFPFLWFFLYYILLLLGMYRGRIRFHIGCHSGKFSRSSTGVFYQILMKRNERTLYRIELLYMMQNNFSQVGQYVSKFWNCQFLQRRCSDQDLILAFQISQSNLNLLNYYFTHCACP